MKQLTKILVMLVVLTGSIFAQSVINAIPAPTNASGLCWVNGYLWCGAYGTQGDTIYKIDPSNGNVLKRLKWRTNADCYGLAFDTMYGGCFFVSDHCTGTDSVWVVDTITGARINAYPSKEYGSGLANNGNYLWHTVYYGPDGQVLYRNKTTGAPFDSFNIPTIPQPWGATWDGQYLWVCNDSNGSGGTGGHGRAYKIDTITRLIVDSIDSPGRRPRGLAWDGTYLWVAAMMVSSPTGWGLYQIDLGGAGTPDIQISPTTYNYNFVRIDSTSSFLFTISNVGTDTLTVDTLFSLNPVFHYQSTTFPLVIPPAQNANLNIYFTPTAFQYYSSSIGIVSDDPDEETVYVTLKGQGVYTNPTLSPSATEYDFLNVRVNCVSDWFLRIVNQGYPVLTIDSIKYDNVQFFNSPVTLPLSLNCLETTYVQVISRANALGAYTGRMELFSNSTPNPSVVGLSGNGIPNNAVGGDLLWEYDFPDNVVCVSQIADINSDGIADVAAECYDAGLSGFKHLRTYWSNSSDTGVVQWSVGDNDFTGGYGDDCLNQGEDYNNDGTPDILLGTAWGDRSVYAIDGKTGQTIWSYDSHSYDGEGGWVYSVKSMPDINGDGVGEVLAGIGGNSTPAGGPRSMYCFSGANGNILWQFRALDAIGTVAWIPDVTGDGIADAICGAWGNSYDKRVYCVSGASSGLTTVSVWSYLCGGDNQSVIVIPDQNGDGKFDVVAGSWSDSVFGLSGLNGQRLWATYVGGDVIKVAAIPDLIGIDRPGIAVARIGNVFNVLDSRDGSIYWNYAIGSNTWTADAIRDVNNDGKNDVITGSQSGMVYCFNGANGSIIWTYNAGHLIFSIRSVSDISFDGKDDVLIGTQGLTGLAKLMAICGGNYPAQPVITASANGPGTIVPSGVIYLNPGEDTTFTILANAGAHLDSLVVDNVNHGTDSTSYQFTNVTTNHTITAYFAINTYTILASATTGGTIIPSGTIVVTEGVDTTFTISANVDFSLDSVLVDGINEGAIPSYTFYAVDDNHTIHAMFSASGITGWAQRESVPAAGDVRPGKYVKDGGAMTAAGLSDQGDEIYTFYGNKSQQFYKYTPSTNTWTALESIPYGYKSTDPTKINKKTPKKGSALCWDGDNTIFAAKGNTNEFWAYYIDADTWVQKAFVPVPKKYKGGTSITFYDGIVYLLAGNQKTSDPTNFYSYIPAADTEGGEPWTSLTGAPLTPNNKKWKDGSAITKMGGLIYALKGGDKYNVFCAYDISAGTWAEIESLPMVHPTLGRKVKVKDGGAVTTDGSAIYAIKGGGKQDFWMYTTIADAGEWIALDTIPKLHKKSVPKTGAALGYADSKIWIMKGNNSLELWRYLPSAMSKVICQMSKPPHTATAIQAEPSSDIIPVFNVVPNPFAKNATIRYSVPVSGRVIIKLYNTNGSLVKTLNDAYVNAGTYTINLSAATLAKGIYFVRFDSETCKTDVKLIIQ